MDIKETIKKINIIMDHPEHKLKPVDILQLSQAALNLAHAEATLVGISSR